jgi:ribosomal protein S15P/S13E
MEYQTLSEIVIQQYQKHKNLSRVGLVLRDEYLIFNVKETYGKNLKCILLENWQNIFLDDCILQSAKKYFKLQNHQKKHRKDLHNKRILKLTENALLRNINHNELIQHNLKSYLKFKKNKLNEKHLEVVLNKYGAET